MCLKIKKKPNMFQCSWNAPLASEMFGFRRPSADCISVFRLHNTLWVLMFLGPPAVRPALLCYRWETIPKITKRGFFLFIFLFIQPFFFFHAAALFPRRTNVLQLIENDPLTAVWNNEASFPHIFSRRMAALSCTSVHIKVPYQGGIWGWRNYWSAWEPGPPYLLLLHRGRDGIMEPKARLSVRRQWLDNAWEGCFLGILDNSVFKSGCIKGNQKATRNLWAVMGSIYDIIASKCVYLALK